MSRFAVLLPELLLALALALMALAALAGGPRRGRWSRRFVTAGLLGSLGAASWTLATGASDDFLFAAYRIDGFSQLAKALVAALVLLANLAGRGDDGQWADARGDSPLFAGLTAMGLTMTASAADLVVLLLTLEVAGLAFVGHVAAGGRRAGAESPARRVLIPRLAATALMFTGVVLLAGIAGSTRFDDVGVVLRDPDAPVVWLAGVALLCSGLFAALGVPPFHTGWIALETNTAPGVAGLGATAFWATAALVVVRLAAQMGPHDATMGAGATVLGGATAIWGLVRALRATDMKRLLADLGIVQAGTLLAALAPQTRAAWGGAALIAVSAALAYGAATLALARAAHGIAKPRVAAADLAGLMRTAPVLGVTFVLALAALAGIPPAAGFTARWAATAAAWQDGWYASAALMIVATVGGAWAIAAPLRALLARGPVTPLSLTLGDRAALAATAVLLLAIGTAPAPVFHWAGRLITFLR